MKTLKKEHGENFAGSYKKLQGIYIWFSCLEAHLGHCDTSTITHFVKIVIAQETFVLVKTYLGPL